MKVYYGTLEASGKIKNAVVTTGSFDGVHIGHKLIIDRLNEMAREIDGESVLITFNPHPRKVLYPEQTDLMLINSQEEKIELLRKAGLDNLIIIPFSLEFSKTTPGEFVAEMLVGHLGAKIIVVGHNHHFGHARQGDYSYLHQLSRELDFHVEEIPLQVIENETVSSTKIRKAIKEGSIQRANAYLDHQYIIIGDLYQFSELPHMSGLTTIGIKVSAREKLIPPPGIYAGNLFCDGQWLKSMTFVLDDVEGNHQVVNYLIYDALDPHGKRGCVYFYKQVWSGNPANGDEMTPEIIDEAKEMVEDLIY